MIDIASIRKSDAQALLVKYYDEEQDFRNQLNNTDPQQKVLQKNLVLQIAVRIGLQELFGSLEMAPANSTSDARNTRVLINEDGEVFEMKTDEKPLAAVVSNKNLDPQLKWPSSVRLNHLRTIADYVSLKMRNEFNYKLNQHDLISEMSEVMEDDTASEIEYEE